MSRLLCPVCGEGKLESTSESVHLDFEGHKIEYISEYSRCNSCGVDLTMPEQSERNRRSIIAAKSRARNLPDKTTLRNWRKRWNLTQKDAGQLLGVGAAAFSKYENASLMPSAPTARLLDAVLESDQVVYLLAKKYDVTIREIIDDQLTKSIQTFLEPKTMSVFSALFNYVNVWDDAVFENINIDGIEELNSSAEETTINARKVTTEIYREWAPSSTPAAGKPFLATGEKCVSYH